MMYDDTELSEAASHTALFAGRSFFLSTKLSLADSRLLSETLRRRGGSIKPSIGDAYAFIVVDSMKPEDVLDQLRKGKMDPLVGKNVIIHCDKENEPFPSQTPMLCFSLRGLVIAFAGLELSKREMLECMVSWCGASVTSELNEETSVLVVGEAASAKLDTARSLNIPLVNAEWVLRCFHTQDIVEHSLFQVKPLKGAMIALSGFRTKPAFEAARSLLVALGAEFVQQLDHKFTITHLVVDPSHMDTGIKSKYYYAKGHGIFVVPVQWLEDCNQHNRWTYEKKYEISNPSSDPQPKKQQMDRERFEAPTSFSNPRANPSHNIASHSHAALSTYLAHCTINLTCPNTDEFARLSSLILGAGGALSSNTSTATHIVIWLDNGVGLVPSNIASQLSSNKRLLAHEWLDACSREQRSVDTFPFVMEMNPLNRLVMWNRASVAGPVTVPSIAPSLPEEVSVQENPKKRPHSDTMQILQGLDPEEMSSVLAPPPAKRASPSGASAMDVDPPTATLPLSACCFIAAYTHSAKLAELITSLGGTVVDLDEGPLPSVGQRIFVIAPHGISSRPLAASLESKLAIYQPNLPPYVTIQWLEHIRKFEQFVDPSIFPLLFTPLPYTREHYQSTMSAVHLCPASITDPEKSLLFGLAAFLGCSVDASLRKTHTTHVISMNLVGKKQQTALALGKHIVTPEWLYCCAKVGCRVAELAFRVKADTPSNGTSSTSVTGPSLLLPAQQHPSSSQARGVDSAMPSATRSEESDEFVDLFAKPTIQQAALQTFKRSPTEVSYDRILDGLVIHFLKLPRDEEEYLTRLARDMGAQTSWVNELNVTHVVAQHKHDLPPSNPPKPSIKAQPKGYSAPESKPIYVAPQWIIKCSQDRMRVSEALYPSSLDSRSALGITMGTNVSDNYNIPLPAGIVHPTFASVAESDFKRPSTSPLNIVQDSYLSNPLSNYSSKPNSYEGGSGKHLTHRKPTMTSVVVPKTRAQTDFEEFDTLDARYSGKKSILTNGALQSAQQRQEIENLTVESLLQDSLTPHIQLHPPQTLDSGSKPIASSAHAQIRPEETVPTVLVPPPEIPATSTTPLHVPSPDSLPMIVPSYESSNAALLPLSTLPESEETAPFFGQPTTETESSVPIQALSDKMDLDMVSNTMKGEETLPRSELPTAGTEQLPIMSLQAIESQEALPSESQPVDDQTVTETKVQTEMMRRLLASMATSNVHRQGSKLPSVPPTIPSAFNPALSAPTSPPVSAQDVLAMPRHIARSALLEMDGTSAQNPGNASATASTALVGVLRSDSSHSSSSERSAHSTAETDDADNNSSLEASTHQSDYLQAGDFDMDRAPRVSYATMEPSDAVKSKMVGRAEQHFDSASFQENAVAELRMLEKMITHNNSTPIGDPDSGTFGSNCSADAPQTPAGLHLPGGQLPHSRQSSMTSISSANSNTRTNSISALTIEPTPQAVANHPIPISVSVPSKIPSNRFPKHQTTIILDDDDVLAALKPLSPKATTSTVLTSTGTISGTSSNMFSRNKKKPTNAPAGTAGQVFGQDAPTVSTALPVTRHPVNAEPAGSIVASSKRKIKVCISGHETTPQGKSEKAQLKQTAQQLGFEVCGLNEFDWTHMVAKAYKTTDRTLISLANGRWILTPDWLHKSLASGRVLSEKEFEWRSTSVLNASTTSIDPRMCRQAVEKLGRGLFEGMRILYALPTPLWKTVLERSGALVTQYKLEPTQPITVSFIRQFDYVLTSSDEWDKLPASERALLNKSSVVVCDYFVRYLTTAEEPIADTFHPASIYR